MSKQLEKSSQPEMILQLLQRGVGITPLEALHIYGVFRLAAVICKLRKDGHRIYTRNKRDLNGHIYAEYYMRELDFNLNKKVA